MKNLKHLRFLAFAFLAGSLVYLSSCGDDDGGEAALDFEGQYAITQASDNDGNLSDAEVLGLLGAALLADNACDTTIAGNFPTLTLVNGSNSTTSGQLLNTCSAEALQEDGGTWLYNATNNTFALTLIVDASPVPVPVTQTDAQINSSAGVVQSIVGNINLSAVIPGFPPSVQLTTARVQ
jgi:hypothetical protein